MTDLLALSTSDRDLILGKLPVLETDPFPDGKMKKKLKSGNGVYRLRAGKYRIFYAFDDCAEDFSPYPGLVPPKGRQGDPQYCSGRFNDIHYACFVHRLAYPPQK